MSISNSQYDALMRSYKAKQLKAQEELSLKIKYINDNLPGYRQLDESIAAFGISATKRMLSGDEVAVSEINATIDNLTQMKKDLLIGAGYSADYLELSYECPDCKDTGYVDGERCHCFRQAVTAMLYENSNLDSILSHDNYDNLSYEYYDGENLQRFQNTVEQTHNFVQNFGSDYQNLLFYGTVGTGKSFLSGCIAKELLDKGYNVIYFSSTELFKLLSDVMFDKGDRVSLAGMKDDIYQADLLIIDDLGTELLTNAVATQLFSLLNERHLSRKSTIISTNLDLQDIQERYSDRIFSRLIEWYSFHKFSGQDIRKTKKTGT